MTRTIEKMFSKEDRVSGGAYINRFLSFLILLSFFAPAGLLACSECRPMVAGGVYNAAFFKSAFLLFLPLIVAMAGAMFFFWDALFLSARQRELVEPSKEASRPPSFGFPPAKPLDPGFGGGDA